MFAIFYISTVAACKLISGTKNLIKNQMSKLDARINNKTGYWDTNGAYKDPYTDEQISYENLKNGDRALKNFNGDVVRNIDEEQRVITIAEKNIELQEQNSKVFLAGRFEDVCPDKLNKGIWKHIPKRTAVYIDKNGQMFFRQPTCKITSPEYMYIKVSDGKYCFLNETNDSDKKWIKSLNKCWEEGTKSFITLSKLADRLI